VLGFPGVLVISGGMYTVGRLGHHESLTALGLRSTEAIALGSGITLLVKGLAGRARPYVSADTSPRDFKFGRGFRGKDYASFPSGHTSAAFAAAAATTSEVTHRWPHARWYVGPVLYGGAAMVGLSRMYNNKHWATDVGAGAAVGTFSGLVVVRYHRAYPNGRIDRLLLRTTLVPTATGGLALAWSSPW
jgi:membrane-associated phospholipid phosphatase